MKDVNITLKESGQLLEVRQGQALEIKPPLCIEIFGVLDSKSASILFDKSTITGILPLFYT